MTGYCGGATIIDPTADELRRPLSLTRGTVFLDTGEWDDDERAMEPVS